jgi:hypothetical protein
VRSRPRASLDFGPGSVDGWLAALVAGELGVDEEPELDAVARELSVQGERVALTPLEFGLLGHLREREGRAVDRRELLAEVWGTEFTGGQQRRRRRRAIAAPQARPGGAGGRDRSRQRLSPARGLARASELTPSGDRLGGHQTTGSQNGQLPGLGTSIRGAAPTGTSRYVT